MVCQPYGLSPRTYGSTTAGGKPRGAAERVAAMVVVAREAVRVAAAMAGERARLGGKGGGSEGGARL